MNQEARTALPLLLPALAAALAFFLAAWRPWQWAAPVRNGHWGGAVALGVGFIIAFITLAGSRGLRLTDRWHWIALMATVAASLGLAASLWRPGFALRLATGAVMAVSVGSLLHPPASAAHPFAWKAALAILAFLLWGNFEALGTRRTGVLLPAVIVVTCGGLSVVLLNAQQAGFSLLAAAVAAVAGMGLLVALFAPAFSLAQGGSYVAGSMLAALCMLGWLYSTSELTIWPLVLILASPLATWVAVLPSVRRMRPWQSALVATIAVAVPVIIAVALSLNASGDEEEFLGDLRSDHTPAGSLAFLDRPTLP